MPMTMRRRPRWWWGAVAAILALASGGAAQRTAPPEPGAAALPFAAGEHAVYRVKLGALTVGSGEMRILGRETVRGHPTLHARLRVSGGLPLARVDDRFDSWMDVDGVFSRRFEQDQRELGHRRHRRYEIVTDSLLYRREDNGEVKPLPTDRPLDDVSFLYYARTLPLKVGDVYTIPRYFQADGNPVVLKVLRRETVRVPAGTFHTVAVQPLIRTSGPLRRGWRGGGLLQRRRAPPGGADAQQGAAHRLAEPAAEGVHPRRAPLSRRLSRSRAAARPAAPPASPPRERPTAR